MEWNRSSACTQGSCVEVAWERSSFCSSATNCVEVARPVTWTVSSYCANGSCVEVGWRKSSLSSGNANCVEVNCQCHDGKVYARDGKLGDASPVMTFTAAEWSEFLEMAREDRIPDDAIEPIEGGLWIAVGDGDYLRFTEDEWDAFVKGVNAGEFTVSEGVSS